MASTLCVSAQKSEDKVSATVAAFIKALEDSDVKMLGSITNAKLTYGHSSGKVENKEQFLQTFKSGASDFVKITITDQTIDVIKKAAIVRHMLEADTNDGGKPGHVKLKVLTVWQKQGSKWVLITRQAVKPAQ